MPNATMSKVTVPMDYDITYPSAADVVVNDTNGDFYIGDLRVNIWTDEYSPGFAMARMTYYPDGTRNAYIPQSIWIKMNNPGSYLDGVLTYKNFRFTFYYDTMILTLDYDTYNKLDGTTTSYTDAQVWFEIPPEGYRNWWTFFGYDTAASCLTWLNSTSIRVVTHPNMLLNIKDAYAKEQLEDMHAYLGYPDDTSIVGLQADFENMTFTRLAGAVGKTAGSDFNVFKMYGDRKLCNLADNGTVNAWYGEQGYIEDGSNGQVMVYQPKFYYKVLPLKLEKIAPEVIDPEAATPEYTEPEGYHLLKANYFISDKPKYGFKVHPAFLDADGNEMDGIYISAYEGSIYDVSAAKYLIYDDMSDDGNYTHDTYLADTTTDKFCSIAGVKPASGLKHTSMTRTGVESMCQNRGSKWHSENAQVVSMEQLLMVIEYGAFNMQTAIGAGVTGITDISTESNTVQTGATTSIGNGTGAATTTTRYISTGATTYTSTDGTNKLSIRYRGRENDWGNMYKFTNGLNIWGNGKKRGGIPYYCDDWTFAESKKTENYISTNITCTKTNGYTRYFGWNVECDWMFIPTLVGTPASATLPVGDYGYYTSNLNGYRIVYRGGLWYYGSLAGPFSWYWHYGVGARSRAIGGRLCCLDC